MKQFLIAVATASLVCLGASAQTGAQATGSSSTNTSVQAGQTKADVNSSNSVDAGASAHRSGSNANAGSEGSSAASVNGAGMNTNSSGSLAAGTTIPATLSKPIDARKAKSGDQVVAKTTQDVRSDSGVVIPRGSRLVGHITDAKAKAKGDSESALGIAFDEAVLKNGQQIPLNASIRALAASASSASASAGDDNFGSTSNSSLGSDLSTSAPRAGGGLLGGASNAVGGATSAVGSTAGGAVNGVSNTAAGVGTNTSATLSGATHGAAGQLTSQSQGVIGLNGLSLSGAASNSISGSVITSAGRDVKLDSGTQMLLQINQ